MLGSIENARFWDRAARKYAKDPIKDMPGYERTLERISHLLNSSDTVLEIGCGTGTTALKLAPSVARVIATDVSHEMIAIAREKAATQACQNVEFSVATAERTPGPDGAYDAVLAFNLPSATVSPIAGRRDFQASKQHCLSTYYVRLKGVNMKWRTRQDSNLRPSPSEGDTLSS